MPTFYLDGAKPGAELMLGRLLPRGRGPWKLYGPDGVVISTFTVSTIRMVTTSTNYGARPEEPFFSVNAHAFHDTSVMAEIHGEGRDDIVLVLRILRLVRENCGGVLMDEDGRVLD
jgi:hypothetical protein